MSDASHSREWDSATYHRLSRPQFGWGMQALSRLKLRGDETVLDVGCGTGKLTAELLARLPRGQVIAVDLSRNMLQSAREQLLPRFAGQIYFLQADMQALPLEAAVDGIFSTAAFHWARNHDLLFAGLYRALKPSGWIEAQCGGGSNLARIRAHADFIRNGPEYREYFAGWQSPWHFSDVETTASRMQRIGFTEVKVWLENAPVQFSTAADLRQYLATVTLHRHLGRLPTEELRQRFLEAIARRAAQDDPPLVMDYWRLNISGKKPQ